jgi:outer membrane protein OmpA-like peptidoglycan-associated protein
MSVTPMGMGEFASRFVNIGVNLGYTFRNEQDVFFDNKRVVIDDQFVGSLSTKIHIINNKLDLVGDAFLGVSSKESNKKQLPFELLAGLRYYANNGMVFDAGAGPGLTNGANTPEFRVFVGMSWHLPEKKIEKRKEEKEFISKPCPECKCPNCPKIKANKVILPSVYFETNKDYVLPQNIYTLKDVVTILKENQNINYVLIMGNADWRSNSKYNMDLAKRRAEYVKKFLISGGVKSDRLFSVTFGKEVPLCDNKSKHGLSCNRRVDLKQVEKNIIDKYKQCEKNNIPDNKCNN